MKFRVDLAKGESIAQAEEKMEKALKKKKECSKGERYCDPILNEFHDQVTEKHSKLVDKILKDIENEIKRNINGRV